MVKDWRLVWLRCSPLYDVVRDAASADLAECGGGGDQGGAPWVEAEGEAQSERGEVGTGSSGEEGAGGEGRRHGPTGRSLSSCPPAPAGG